MNVWPKVHGNPTTSRQSISLKTKNANLMVVLEEKSGITKVIRIPPLGTMYICTKFEWKSNQ